LWGHWERLCLPDVSSPGDWVREGGSLRITSMGRRMEYRDDHMAKSCISIGMGFALIFIGCLATVAQTGTTGRPQGEGPSLEKRYFRYGAKKYGLRILEAVITLEEAQAKAGEKVYVVQAQVDTTGVTNWFFRMHNRFHSWVDAGHFGSLRYVKEINQDGIFSGEKCYRSVLTFHREENRVVMDGEKELSVPPGTQDPLSFFVRYYLGEEIKPDEEIRMTIYDGIKLRKVSFAAKGECIETEWGGPVDVICLKSKVPFSSLGGREGIIRIWFTRDRRKVPVRIGLDLPIGTVQFDLESFQEG